MKGVVFHFGSKHHSVHSSEHPSRSLSLKALFTRYGLISFLSTLFVMGLFVGAVCSRGIGDSANQRLDFLFVTNLAARGEMSGFGIFLSCFVPYFLFILLTFLFAVSAWGFVAIPLLSAFKGFSVGLSSAIVFAAYRVSGIGFYILIILPGTVMFLFAFFRYSRECFRLSVRFARITVMSAVASLSLRLDIRAFLKKSLLAFVFSGACSVVDMLLWVLFADKFHFT